MNNGDITKFALKYHESILTPLQISFLKLCSIKLTQNIITSELNQYKDHPKSKLLSLLKKLSIKHKIYSFTVTKYTYFNRDQVQFLCIDTYSRKIDSR